MLARAVEELDMFKIEVTVDGDWHVGFDRYTLMYDNVRVCLFDLGFVQVKLVRRKHK
jgi:hypothetical protein